MDSDKTSWIGQHWKDLLFAVLGVIIISLVMNTTCVNQKNNQLETNLKAMTDSVHTYKLKNGELMFEKQGFIAEKADLEKYIGVQEKEIKDIERKLNAALATISKLKAEMHVDTIHTHDSIVVAPDSTYYNHFSYGDKWLALDGQTSFRLDPFQSHTIINGINMEIPLKVGTTTDDQWFVTTECPYIQFTNIEGANIAKAKPKRFVLGVQFGVGGLGGYGVCFAPNGTVYHGWMVGGGLYVGLGGTIKLVEF